MWHAAFLLVLAGAAALTSVHSDKDLGDEITWKKVRYLGGVPGVRVDRLEFEHTLTLSPSKVIVRVAPPPTTYSSTSVKKSPRVLFEVPRASVLALTYSGFRHDMPSAQSWIGIPGRWPKATDHLIIIEYRLPDGGEAEVLLRVDKDDYQEILDVLRKILQARETTSATH